MPHPSHKSASVRSVLRAAALSAPVVLLLAAVAALALAYLGHWPALLTLFLAGSAGSFACALRLSRAVEANRALRQEIFWHARRLESAIGELEAEIIEHENSERALESLNASLAGILDAASRVAIVATDQNGLVTTFNRGAEEILGYRPEDVIGRLTPEAFILPSDLEAYAEEISPRFTGPVRGLDALVAIARRGGSETREWGMLRSDGTGIIAQMTVSSVRGNADEPLGFLAVAVDITKRKKAEQALAKSEARLKGLVETAVDGIVTVDSRGIIGSVNRAATEMFGYTAWELVGRNVSILMPEPFRSRHDRFIERYLGTGQARVIGQGGRELNGLRKDGGEFPLELALSELKIGGEVLFTGIMRDITQRKKAEQALVWANAMLADRQMRLDADLKAAAEIQRNLLPKANPAPDRLDVDWRFQPSASIGGDIFSLVCLDQDHVAVYMLDVSGHGVPSALVALLVTQELQAGRGILVRASRRGEAFVPMPPAEVLKALDKVFPLERFDKYLTMFYMVVNCRTGLARYSCAGHPPPLLARARGGMEALDEGGPVIGLGQDMSFDEGEIALEPGDTVLVYTDGCTESSAPDGEVFGEAGLRQAFFESRGEPVGGILENIWSGIQSFAKGAEQKDDISLLCFRIKGHENNGGGA
ncbi:MAG: PAS domain S-box protein [Desulfovibrionaceae bacterium]|nr:PAS domain S-box protein [Desulfovibrionaceae bacterium]